MALIIVHFCILSSKCQDKAKIVLLGLMTLLRCNTIRLRNLVPLKIRGKDMEIFILLEHTNCEIKISIQFDELKINTRQLSTKAFANYRQFRARAASSSPLVSLPYW